MEDGIFEFIKWALNEYGFGAFGFLVGGGALWLKERDAKLIREVVVSNTEIITKLTVLFEERMPRRK